MNIQFCVVAFITKDYWTHCVSRSCRTLTMTPPPPWTEEPGSTKSILSFVRTLKIQSILFIGHVSNCQEWFYWRYWQYCSLSSDARCHALKLRARWKHPPFSRVVAGRLISNQALKSSPLYYALWFLIVFRFSLATRLTSQIQLWFSSVLWYLTTSQP